MRSGLPAAPARVVEVGAGEGALAAALRADGYDVVAIDPAPGGPGVREVALLDLDDGVFDAAVAVVSLHHLEPLEASCRRLAEVVRPGGALVVDELDVERIDERAAGWLLARLGIDDRTPADVVAEMRHHCHPLPRVLAALREGFELEPLVRRPYLHRWARAPEQRGAEEALIAAGELPVVGARVVGVRR